MKKIKGRRITPINTQNRSVTKSVHYLLESGSLSQMRAAKQVTAEHLKYQWDLYCELARQRNVIDDKIKSALIQTCIPYEIKHYQRAVKYKYSLHPLSVMGSLTFIGGRFNTGKELIRKFQIFQDCILRKIKKLLCKNIWVKNPCLKGLS